MSLITATLPILLLTAFTVSGVQKFTVTPDRGTVLNIRSSQVKGCRVCATAGRSRQCDTSLLLKDNAPASVEFECSRPQDIFNVEIVQNIECTTKSCSSHIVQADSGSRPLVDFNRKFTWNLRASAPKAFRIDFAGSTSGLRQVKASEGCPDGHSYTLRALQATGDVAVGKYCRVGPISDAQILNRGSLSLDVAAGQKLQNGQFHVSVGEEIKSLAKITLTLPTGTSSVELLSANYPDSFPDDDVMEWYFQVPDKHRTTVQLSNLTQPRCLKKDTAVEYHSSGRGASVLRLTDPQPDQTLGSFSLTLRNCEMDRRRAGSPGLSLSLKVSSQTSTVSCQVDVSKMDGLSLRIEKLRLASGCQMKINSVPKEVIAVTSKSDLSFQGCLPEDILITAMRVVECRQLKDCPKAPVRLTVPPLPPCLPAPLSSVTWTLRPPRHGTVELTSPMGHLRQSLPGQPCNGSVVIEVAEDDGATVGRFCPLGAIQKVQVHNNVSVTLSNMGGKTPRTAVLYAVMKEEIPERYIFNVSPKRDAPVLLATPGWPVGMRDYSTVSWIVSVPTRMEAHLVFTNLSQPKCSTRHTNIRVQRVGRLEEDYSRREDEEAESEIVVSESFYLNMSNCMAERGDFSVVARITLQKSINLLLTIILSVVAALLVIFVIVLVVVCVVIKRKKKRLAHQVSIYNPNGASFLPGLNGVPETREGSDDHVYASIDDTLVYTHLLRKWGEASDGGEFDTYRPFTGYTESPRPPVSKDDGADGSRQQARLSSGQAAPPVPLRPLSHNRSLVDNVIYQTEDQGDEERSLSLGPRLEPEGGN